MPCQESRSHPRPRYPDRAGPYRAPVAHAGDSHIVLSHQEFDFIIEQQERMISLMNMLVQQNSRPNITPVVQTLPRHVRSSLAGQANAGGRSSLDRVAGLMPPTGPRGRGQTTVRGRRHFRNQNRRDRRVRDGQGMEAAQAPAGEAGVDDNGAALVERVEYNTYDAVTDGDWLSMDVKDEDLLRGDGWVEGEEDISSSNSTVA